MTIASSNDCAFGTATCFQERILPGVSRTFALTIPCLPEPLKIAVTNAYLLCRIADTIEDDPDLDTTAKCEFGRQLVAVIAGRRKAQAFSRELLPLLSETTPADERKLIANCHQVIKVTHRLDERELAAVTRCLSVMTEGMQKYQRISGLHGLADIAQVDEYCYFVAGVVGEMLTELFCCYSLEIQSRRSRLMRLAPSFGQGLQMTNILKDVWEDHRRGTCWLPRSGFDADPGRIGDLLGQTDPQTYREGMRTLISIAHFHLRNALDFTLLIPAHETGIRRFCLWAQGLAVLTLRKIHRHPDFTSGQEVKVTRRTVGLVVAVCSRCASHNRILRCLFASVSIGLPKGTSIVTCNWPTTFDAGSYDETAARGTLDIKK